MNIGICGGTFDPFHRGHLEPILAVREAMQWERILYIPAYVQPLKQERTLASPYHRFAMLTAAIEGLEFAYASPIELDRQRVSYTVETLEALRAAHPGDTLDWVIGDDNLDTLLQWKSPERILELANFAVLARRDREVPASFAANVRDADGRPPHGAIVFAHNATLAISSTDVRQRVHDGDPIDELVSPAVSRYIHHYGLYGKAHS
jgi:nicotinate-nucleotide adenylyltransferase